MFQFSFLSRCWPRAGLPLLLAVLPLTPGTMPLWSQGNGSSLSGSQGTLQTWNELYSQGQRIYEQQSSTLASLDREISTLRTGYAELTNLYEQLSRSNENLRVFNGQIGQRMQERDEDLAWAYGELSAMDIAIAEKDVLVWKLIAAVIAMGAVILGAFAFAAIKFYAKRKIPAL